MAKYSSYSRRTDGEWAATTLMFNAFCANTGMEKGEAASRFLDYCLREYEKGNCGMVNGKFQRIEKDTTNGVTE